MGIALPILPFKMQMKYFNSTSTIKTNFQINVENLLKPHLSVRNRWCSAQIHLIIADCWSFFNIVGCVVFKHRLWLIVPFGVGVIFNFIISI